jgi:cytochrome c2
VWQNETLFEYLYNPLKNVPKTKMMFPGFKYAQDRADVIQYLRQVRCRLNVTNSRRDGLTYRII